MWSYKGGGEIKTQLLVDWLFTACHCSEQQKTLADLRKRALSAAYGGPCSGVFSGVKCFFSVNISTLVDSNQISVVFQELKSKKKKKKKKKKMVFLLLPTLPVIFFLCGALYNNLAGLSAAADSVSSVSSCWHCWLLNLPLRSNYKECAGGAVYQPAIEFCSHPSLTLIIV